MYIYIYARFAEGNTCKCAENGRNVAILGQAHSNSHPPLLDLFQRGEGRMAVPVWARSSEARGRTQPPRSERVDPAHIGEEIEALLARHRPSGGTSLHQTQGGQNPWRPPTRGFQLVLPGSFDPLRETRNQKGGRVGQPKRGPSLERPLEFLQWALGLRGWR